MEYIVKYKKWEYLENYMSGYYVDLYYCGYDVKRYGYLFSDKDFEKVGGLHSNDKKYLRSEECIKIIIDKKINMYEFVCPTLKTNKIEKYYKKQFI